MHANTTSIFEKILYLILAFCLLVMHRYCYGRIGDLNALSGIDYSHFIRMPIDNSIPLIPILIIPYMSIWVIPMVLIFYFVIKYYDRATAQIMLITVLAMMISSYIIWAAFPAKIHLRMPYDVVGHQGILYQGIFYIYKVATPWNVMPSFHTAYPYFIWRCSRWVFPELKWFNFIFFILVAMSTVAIRNHYFLDIIGGIILSEVIYQTIFVNLMRKRQSITKYSNVIFVLLFSGISLATISIINAGVYYVNMG